MKTIITILSAFLIVAFFSTNMIAQDSSKTNSVKQTKNNVKSNANKKAKHGLGFVDADGDGYNDNAPDHDGDGIPNGLDQDYKKSKKMRGFVDLDGDGINDNQGMGFGNGKGSQMKGNNTFGNKGMGNQGNVGGIGNDDSNMGGSGSKGQKGKGKQK